MDVKDREMDAVAGESAKSSSFKENGTNEKDLQNNFLKVPSAAIGTDHCQKATIGVGSRTRTLSVSSRSSETVEKPKKHKELKLKIFIGVLFCMIFVGVIIIYHFYNRKIYQLEIGTLFVFDEIERTLQIRNNDGNVVLKGELGLTLPHEMVPYNCEPEKTHRESSCIGYKHKARIFIDYDEAESINCYHMSWLSEDEYTYPYDCYDFGEAHWYGGILPMVGDFQDLQFDARPFITSSTNRPEGLGPVIEPSWLTTKVVAIYVDGDPPLHISVNKMDKNNNTDGRFCLLSRYSDSPYQNPNDNSPWLNYTVCTATNMLDMHKHMLRRVSTYNPRPAKAPTTDDFKQIVYNTWAQYKKEINQSEVMRMLDQLVENDMDKGVILIQESWQAHHGDLKFDTGQFPNVSAMFDEVHSKGFQIGVSVTNLVGTDSEEFQVRIADGSLVKDAGGLTEGLVDYYLGPHTEKWHEIHAGAIDFTSTSYHAGANISLRMAVKHALENVQVDEVYYDGAQVDLLPYRPHFDPFFETPNLYTSGYVAKVPQEPWSKTQAGYKSQNLDNFIRLFDSNTTLERKLNGYESVLPQALALGIMGYPFFVHSSIGGCYYEPLDSSTDTLYARWAQLISFFPVMEFGVLPDKFSKDMVAMVNSLTGNHNFIVFNAIIEVLEDAYKDLHPLIRPLWWHDPHDEKCIAIKDQFMVGRRLLVAPIMNPEDTMRDIYLPSGLWRDMVTNERLAGPMVINDYNADIYTIPYFSLEQSVDQDMI